LASLALLGTLATGCAKHEHHLPSTEPTGAPCGTPTSAATTAASSSSQSVTRRVAAAVTPGPEQTPNLTTITFQSNPTGFCVQVQDANGDFSKIGNTPVKNTPAFSNTPYTFEVIPRNGNSPYSYSIDQTAVADLEVLYNQDADTTGQITQITDLSSKRKLTASHSKLNASSMVRHLAAKHVARPGYSTSLLEVRYRSAMLQQHGRQAADLERLARAGQGKDIGFVRNGLKTRIVHVAQGDTLAALGARLQGQAEVYDVHPVGLRYTLSTSPVIPNDTLFDSSDQWDMYHIQAPNAWGYTEGSTGVTIGIIDTGADQFNTDLAGKLAYGESVIGGVVTTGLNASQDEDGHGTNVSGIASADTNNGIGVAGVGWNTPIDIFRIFPYGDNTSASTSDEAQAIYDAVARGVNVINLSLGSGEDGGWDSVEFDAVEYAITNNVTVVAAAGNERTTTSSPGVDFPGAYAGVIAVGATSLNDSANPGNPASPTYEYVSSYSNVGPQLSIVAPGGDPNCSGSGVCDDSDVLHWITNLYTTTPYDSSQTCQVGPVCLALYAGTSQATPHVTGTVALMLAEAKIKSTTLTPANIKQILQSTADNISDPNQGNGRLNAYRALAAVAGDTRNIAQPSFNNFVAFAYDNVNQGATVPHIIDVTYPNGAPVDATTGSFRIADIMTSAKKYRIAVWADLNGDGKVDAGDYFIATQDTCTPTAPCTEAESLIAVPVASGFTLP